MPVEIRELRIRTTVDKQNKTPKKEASKEDCTESSPSEANQLQADEVLKMIRNQNER